MANPEHLKALKEGVEAWNAWREVNPETKPNLSGADLSGAHLRKARLSGADLSGASLDGADLHDADLRSADLQGADLRGADLVYAKLRHTNLSGADLREADLRGAVFRRGTLSRARVADASLRGANLSGANLRGTDLSRAVLNSTNLSGADLSRADFRGARLIDANLSDTNLIGANLSRANLANADLSNANLSDANFSDANLKQSDLKAAYLSHVVFGNVDLRKAKSLELCKHRGSSTISTTTLTKSKGRIPEIFLKGCGLSDWEIAAAKLHDPDLTSEQMLDLTYEVFDIKAESPIQINPIFISYRRTDSDFVEAIEPLLDEKRLRYWRDVHDMVSGPIEEQVERAIEHNRIMLLVLSKDSVESRWVEWEVKKADNLAQENREHVLCPIALDDSWESCRWPGWLRDQIEKYNILDFSKWKDENAMSAAFQKLIDGLGIYYPKDVAG